jgi:hypothetical protein
VPIPLPTLRFVTLLLAALALTMETAHVLELPQKLQYDAELYSAVNTTLYRYFAVVGGPLQIGSLLAAIALVTAGDRRRVGWTAELAGALALTAAFAVWLTVVAPVNGRIAERLVMTPHQVPSLWMELRLRWELGHAAGFVLQLIGFALLLRAALYAAPPLPQAQSSNRAENADQVPVDGVDPQAAPPRTEHASNEARPQLAASMSASDARPPQPDVRRSMRASRVGRGHLTLVRHP